jgi:hypothetical protein
MKENLLSKKLTTIKIKEPETFALLKKLVDQSGNKPYDWNKLPSNINEKQLQTLENYGLIFFKDYSDYVVLFSGLKNIISNIK